MKPSDIRNHISQQCGFTPNKAKHRQDLRVKLSPERLAHLESICQHHPAKPYALQVCNAGAMPDHLPASFEDWIKQGNDAIDDPGGNIIPSRVQSNHDQYDNDKHPFE